jgi:flagellar biosynthetic protein FlhB
MAQGDGQEKTEQPTSKKLSDARDKGQVAKSIEINSLMVFGSGLIMIFLLKSFIGEKFHDFSVDMFSTMANLNLNKTIIQAYFLKWALFFFSIVTPILFTILVVGIVSNVGQFGFRFTTKVMKPDFGKFNPINGLKNSFFSTRPWVEVGKSIVKFFIITLFTYYLISDLIKETTLLIELSIEETVTFMLNAAFSLVWKIVLFFVALAAADFIFQKFKFKKEMMMTKEEIKEEYKQLEGDPVIKSRIRKQMLTFARKRMMKDVPKADVVITNPTHYAIAVKYEMSKDSAPRVLAKGMDELAQRIKRIATENNVPLHENRELARALYKTTEVGDQIPTKLFKAVAQILAYIYQMRKLKKKRSIV